MHPLVIPTEKRIELWNEFLERKPWPNGVTAKRLEKYQGNLLAYEVLWTDLSAHGLNRMSLAQLAVTDRFTADHAVGNFWGMVSGWMVRYGIIKV